MIPLTVPEIRRLLAAMLSRVDLPDLLLEAHAWTGYLDAYTHASGASARVEDLPQLTVQESRHRLARKIFHGQRGEVRQAYREGQEDQLGAPRPGAQRRGAVERPLHRRRVAAPRSFGCPVADEGAARLSPLGDKSVLGRYAFAPPAGPELRPLRDPASPGNDQ